VWLPGLPEVTGGRPVNAAVGSSKANMPLDIATFRETAAVLLGSHDAPDVLPPAPREPATLIALLRGHLEQLIPEVKARAAQLPKDSVLRYCALACVGEASGELRLEDGCTPPARVAVARKLARCVRALCDHYENVRAEQS
jgi:Family of unknown function (DUF6415)